MTTSERPTAKIRRVDVSASSDGASAARSSEDLLFRGYGSLEPGQSGVFKVTDRSEKCQCGGLLELRGDAVVEQIVAAHNESALHKAWRAWREADGKPTKDAA